MTRIGPILVLLPVACVAQVHNFQFPRMGGSYYASSFANWTASTQTPVMAPGLATVQITPAKVTLVANDQIQPVAVGVPVLVQAGGASETVTPVSVSCTPQACAMTATFAYAHPGGFTITSASDGLDEAIEVAAAQGGGTVVVGSDWSGTTAQITGAAGTAVAAVLDSRSGASVRYAWNGSQYQVALAMAANGGLQSASPAITPTSIESALFADQFNGTDMCAKANAATASLGASGGTVVIPRGTYSCSTQITIPANVALIGQGALATTLMFTSGGDEILMNGIAHASLANLSVSLPSSLAAVALHMEGSTPQSCAYNSVIGVDFSAPLLFAGQFGIRMDGNSCVFNSFHHLVIRSIDQPIYISGNAEGNHWSDVQANGFAATNAGAGIYAGGNDDQFTGVRCSLGSSVANPIYCINFVGEFNQANNIFADMGGNGSAIEGSGARTQMVSVGAIGSTAAGIVTGGYTNAIGRDQNPSSYEVNDLSTTGANRFVFQAGVSGFSNGFTVDYQDSPHDIRFTFNDGPVGVGVTPAFGSGIGIYGSNWTMNGAGAAWGGGASITSSSVVAQTSQLPLSGAVAGSTTSLAANSCGDTVAATIAGATTAMVAIASGNGALPSAGLTIQAAVTAANTVTVEYCNLTTAAIVPAALTINLRVVQ